MKIAYLGQMADVATENGISKKIRMQTGHWQKAGHDVRYFSLVPATAAWSGLAALRPELVPRGNLAQRILGSYRLAAKIRAWQPDGIYFRYAYHSPGLQNLFRAIPTIAELNSDDRTEYPTTLSRGKVIYHRLTRGRILRAIRAFVPVTHELAQRVAEFGRPHEVIANGVELDDFVSAPPPFPGSPLRLIFVGSAGAPWHGLERLAEIARLFPQATVDVVGCRADEVVDPAPTMRFHGHLPRSEYEPLFAGATAAVATMALFRKKMEEACPLKVREYLALGMPVIAAYRDTDVPDDADYFLRLPNNAAPLTSHRERIGAWLESWHGRRVPRASVAHLDYAAKERQRLAFLQRFWTAA